ATEALRVLAEMTRTLDAEVAAICERLRFETYDLEKSVFEAVYKLDKLERIGLYVLINVDPQTTDAAARELARRCIAGGADALQLRAKNLSDRRFLSLAESFIDVCRTNGALGIINDRADIAALAQADGVHLGQDEILPKSARILLKRPMLIGGSTHAINELNEAVTAGYDYVGVGPAFASPTKPGLTPAGLGYIRQAVQRLASTSIRPVAIGGINAQNLPAVLETGIRAVAVASAILDNPEKQCRQLKAIIVRS
ncbi:MAG TPA: thiamine phosphate synthase, partial [Phycisphaerales bacterium]|nr:thiamine phosphate synthase [Phycisphaerales bacterium]